MTMRIAIARLWYEANSFTPVRARLADFQAREWYAGDAAPRFYAGTRTELGAAVDFFRAQPDLEPIYLRCAAAPPGGPVDEDDLQRIIGEIVDGVRHAKADALYLSLHGALLGTRTLKADLSLLHAAREALGNKPLAASFDLHANLDPAIAGVVDIAVGYKTHPHVDMYETGQKTLTLLLRQLRGEIAPVVAIAKAGAILPSFNMRTASGPMAEIEALAVCERPGILDATPFGGFAYGDTPCAGASVTVTADGDRAHAEQVALELARAMHARRDRFRVDLPPPERAFRFEPGAGPVAILEPSDNPLSGGVGDTTGLFRALLDWRGRGVFAFFWDPELASRCVRGKRMRVQLGGRLSESWGPPVELDVDVERVTDGRFRNRGPMERGLEVNLGRTAVLRAGELRVIVTSSCQSPNDPEYFALHGIALDDVDVVCVKAKNHFRAAFGDRFASIVEVDTVGPATARLASLPFRHVPREFLAA